MDDPCDDEEDDIIREVRANREQLFAEFGYDLHKLGEYLRAQDAKGDRVVVNLSGRPSSAESVPPAEPSAKAG